VKPSLSEQAYQVVKHDIITCVLEPGQQIAQQQLAKRYQLGKTPIREALQRLAQEGLVQPIPRFGYTVSYVTLCDVHEIFELRLVLEPAAARLAATRGTHEQLDSLAQVADLTYIDRDGQRVPDFSVHNARFHRAIAAASGNQRLFDSLSRVLDEMMRIFYLGLDLSESAEEMRHEHLDLVQTLTTRDPDRAEQLMLCQIARSKDRVLKALTHRLGALGQAVPVGSLNSVQTPSHYSVI
jgi:DNA-binding GntR family transcriptional regulator